MFHIKMKCGTALWLLPFYGVINWLNVQHITIKCVKKYSIWQGPKGQTHKWYLLQLTHFQSYFCLDNYACTSEHTPVN